VVVVVVLGVAGSILGGVLWRESVRREQRQAFDTAAIDVTDTAETLISQDVDYLRALRIALQQTPGASRTQLAYWGNELHSSQLGVLNTLAGRYGPIARPAQPHSRSARARVMGEMLDTGAFLVHTSSVRGTSALVIECAFFGPGARGAHALGWVSSLFSLSMLASQALEPYTRLSISLSHRNPGGALERIGGSGHTQHAPRYVLSSSYQSAGSWVIRVAGEARRPALSASAQGVLVLVGGLLATLLLAALVITLGRSREQALGLVGERTGELRHQALHDALTGLPNRVLALDRAEQMLSRARRQHVAVAALYIDIDGFKQVNDTFGHAAGDELLRTVAGRLADVVRDGDTAARLGGDEFVVLVEGADLDAGPELVAERIMEVLRQPYVLGADVGRPLALTASIGIAVGERGSADELLRDADLALYEAKAANRDCYVLFESEMQTAAENRLTLQLDLADALADGQLFLLYQPLFDLSSEQMIGVEALIRWRHPTHGVVPPDRFIPLAEESGLILPIGHWVLREACRQAASWRRRGHELGVSVNVSARQLDSDGLIGEVREALKENNLEPSLLTLEVTETALMRDPEATATRLRALKGLGVRIAIDDFGTGYSSLAYLRQFPADSLKIDRSFINDIADSEQSTALIHTFVQLGKTLHLQTLAEGIEDRSQLRALQHEDCELGQGFLFSRPLQADAIEELLDGAESSERMSSWAG
jgi:diguanylate cyclase (GGDEF)-like protein